MKAQISVVEVTLLFVLFGLFAVSFSTVQEPQDPPIRNQITSLLDALYQNESFRSNVMQEDLATLGPDQNWSPHMSTISNVFGSFEFQVGNSSKLDLIRRCRGIYGAEFVEKIIVIESNTNYELRRVRLGVCY